MQKSSITKLYGRGPNSEFARRLGLTIRIHRLAAGLTQTQLGFPLTKAFVSQVECGRTLPSLPALSLMADRLGISMGRLLDEVNGGLPRVYTPADEKQYQTTGRSR